MFINRLADAERFDEAVKLAKLSFAASRELGEERIVAYLTVRGKELVASQARFVAAKAALAILRERPADPAANEQAGLWFWLDKLDRDRGFTYLAKAEDVQLRAAVTAALAMPPRPDAQLKLADVWWDLGKGLAPGAKLRGDSPRGAPVVSAGIGPLASGEFCGLQTSCRTRARNWIEVGAGTRDQSRSRDDQTAARPG